MIDLCIDARMAQYSGIGTCIRNLVPLLDRPPFRLTLLTAPGDQPWFRGIKQIILSSPVYSIREQFELPLKIPRSDLFWSPHYNIPMLPIRSKKRIVTIHDACHLALSQYLSLPERLYAKAVMKRAYLQSDLVLTDSNFSKTELKHFLGDTKRIAVVPMAVCKKQFQKITDIQALSRIRDKYKLPEQFLLFIGNLKPHKNLNGLLEAFSQLQFPELHLVLVGKFRELRNSIGKVEKEKVLTLGHVPEEDLSSFYTLAKGLILPSFYEGFGLPPLEAMGCGCPTIVSKTASLPEVCGDASFYIDPRDPGDLAYALRKLIKEPSLREELIKKGLSQIQKYSWDKTAAEYRDFFEKVHYA